jgi:hypothetical protein
VVPLLGCVLRPTFILVMIFVSSKKAISVVVFLDCPFSNVIRFRNFRDSFFVISKDLELLFLSQGFCLLRFFLYSLSLAKSTQCERAARKWLKPQSSIRTDFQARRERSVAGGAGRGIDVVPFARSRLLTAALIFFGLGSLLGPARGPFLARMFWNVSAIGTNNPNLESRISLYTSSLNLKSKSQISERLPVDWVLSPSEPDSGTAIHFPGLLVRLRVLVLPEWEV